MEPDDDGLTFWQRMELLLAQHLLAEQNVGPGEGEELRGTGRGT